MDLNKALTDALLLALTILVPAVIALAAAYVKAVVKKLNADSAPGIALAVVAEVEAAAKAAGGLPGIEKKGLAAIILRRAGQAFAIGNIEQAVAKLKPAQEPTPEGG